MWLFVNNGSNHFAIARPIGFDDTWDSVFESDFLYYEGLLAKGRAGVSLFILFLGDKVWITLCIYNELNKRKEV